MGKKKTFFGESLIRNKWSYTFYVYVLTEVALSQFEWNGLPASVDRRYLELILFRNGSSVYFNDPVIGGLAMAVIPKGKLMYNGEPLDRQAWSGYNGYTAELDNTDSVLIWNNLAHTNTVLMCELFAQRLWEYDRIIDVNVRAQKTPILLQASESERLSVKNAYKDFDGNEPVIFGTNNFNAQALKAISTGAPFVADKLYNLKMQVWNECLTYFGISNLVLTKRAQVTKDEVERSMGGTLACRNSRLAARQESCEKINEMFGLSAEVSVREDFVDKVQDTSYDGLGGIANV